MALCADCFLTGCSSSASFAYFVWTSSLPKVIHAKWWQNRWSRCCAAPLLSATEVPEDLCTALYCKQHVIPSSSKTSQQHSQPSCWGFIEAECISLKELGLKSCSSASPALRQAVGWRSEQGVRASEAASKDLLRCSHAGGGPKKPADGLKAFTSIANPACSSSPWDVPPSGLLEITSLKDHTEEPGQDADSNRARLPAEWECWERASNGGLVPCLPQSKYGSKFSYCHSNCRGKLTQCNPVPPFPDPWSGDPGSLFSHKPGNSLTNRFSSRLTLTTKAA